MPYNENGKRFKQVNRHNYDQVDAHSSGTRFAPSQSKPWYKRPLFWIVIFAILALAGGAGSQGGNSGDPSTSTPQNSAQSDVAARNLSNLSVGETASFDKYEVTLDSVEYGDGVLTASVTGTGAGRAPI